MTSPEIITLFPAQSDINSNLAAGFYLFQNAPGVRKSHLFHGRYENIYLTTEHVPELARLLQLAREHASAYLGRQGVRAGCWFNVMPPGAVTTRHNHDDADELLSAVYYVRVPDNSGELLLHDQQPATRITPVAGQLIFFSPTLDHEVTTNNSDQDRLSIAINFGPADEDD